MVFNENSKLMELLSNDAASLVLEKHLPGITTNSMISTVEALSLKKLASFPQANLSDEIIAAIVDDLKKIDTKSSSLRVPGVLKREVPTKVEEEDIKISPKENIQIRDPFILRNDQENCYYLYGTTDKDTWSGPGTGFNVYRSEDLEQWEGPYPAFRPQPDFWAETNFWAPEVHEYKGKYYMLASFKAEGISRGTQILIADEPIGPFHPHSKMPVTPAGWDCLDGTLFIDANNQPWMIFCHEWLQIENGTINAIMLSESLDSSIGDPVCLFAANEAPWVTEMYPDTTYYVTDGPFLYRCADGTLLMLWSSYKNGKYAQGIAKSESGQIQGPWLQSDDPLFEGDGGHGMIFKTFDDEVMLTLHSPNDTPNERVIFIKLKEHNGQLIVASD